MSGKVTNRSHCTPPIAAVNVTPMIVDRAVVAPSMDSPTDIEGSMKYTAIAPILAAPSPRLMACRPGSSRGAESSRPCSLPYATSEPLQITIIMINLGGTVAQL
jgi:hypothetical protein